MKYLIALAALLSPDVFAAATDTLLIESQTRITVYTGTILAVFGSSNFIAFDANSEFTVQRDEISFDGFEDNSNPTLVEWYWEPYTPTDHTVFSGQCSFSQNTSGGKNTAMYCPGLYP